jgi:hypothetical protein
VGKFLSNEDLKETDVERDSNACKCRPVETKVDEEKEEETTMHY